MPPPKDKPVSGEMVEVWDYVSKRFDFAHPVRILAVFYKDLHDNWMVELESGLLVSVKATHYESTKQPPWREVRADAQH